jgi:hypothetical protein
MRSAPLDKAIDWLFNQGGPVIRWRVASELFDDFPSGELTLLERDLLELPLIQTWLGRLTLGELGGRLERLDPEDLKQLGWLAHSSKQTALENVLGKLAELGLRSGMPGLDERMLPLSRIFRWRASLTDDALYQSAWESLVKSIFAWGLLRTGYAIDEPLKDYLLEHLQICHKIARDQVYDLYANGSELAGLPKAWVGKPILKQDVMVNYHLPRIHDLYILASFPAELRNPETTRQIDDILMYIQDPRFQAFPDGFGYAWIKEQHTCYSWGWSPHLPGFNGFEFLPSYYAGMLVQRLELMGRFPQVHRSLWYHEALAHLEKYRTDQGRYCFPAGYLRELPSGYYVTGAYMGLGENRRKPLGLEIESTFRMFKILKQDH